MMLHVAKRPLSATMVIGLAMALTACTGGSGSNKRDYSVGGTVSGLGAGLAVTLLNNGGNALTVNADGSFTFSDRLKSGAAYAVTVGTQPAGQTCTVNNGTGTLASANVSNIAVTCSDVPGTYTIGGAVSGLGSGLSVTLLNNGGNSLVVNSNGPFTFTTAAVTGAAYSVTVGSQPTGQTCTVGNGSGTLASANVSDVAVTCADVSTSSTVVNSLLDSAAPPPGTTTLRSALAQAAPGQPITFDASLDGGTIALSIVGDEHTLLKGEVMGMRNEPSGPVSYLVGYFDRDYGRSALVARKDVVIDASNLPSGITIAWTGGIQPGARVLAVDGNLTLTNVSITGGHSTAEAISITDPYPQPWTLARGGALAVWGVARLVNCRLYDNHVQGDFDSSRDRGAFGGAVYADIVEMQGCVVSGNTVLGGGAAGGGVYSVGGAGHAETISTIDQSTVSGNRISGLFTYGAGVFSDGGSIGNRKTLRLTNSTIARNLAEPAPGLPRFLLAMGYWRGGGVYMSNGYLEIQSCTIAENEVYGVPRTDSLGRRNLAGGIAATVGNAHAVEDLVVGNSIVVGNTVQEVGGSRYAQDIYTGSLFYFRSTGYNRIGVLDFSQILVPVGRPGWASLSRKHYPQPGDADGVELPDVIDLTSGIVRSTSIVSAGTDKGDLAVLHYQPGSSALGQVLASYYFIDETLADYAVESGATDDFLAIVLKRLESRYAIPGFADGFKADFEAFLQTVDSDPATSGVQPYTDSAGNPILTLDATHWFGPAQTWPTELENHPYIHFWHRLDVALVAAAIPGMGTELLGDGAWRLLFASGSLAENPAIRMTLSTRRLGIRTLSVDQLGRARPRVSPADIGAIEMP